MHSRREPFAASGAMGPGAGVALFLVELDTDLGGTLEDVKKLSERQIQESGNHSHGVKDREKIVEVPAQPRRRNGQSKPGHGNCREQDQWEEIHAEGRNCLSTLVAHPAPE